MGSTLLIAAIIVGAIVLFILLFSLLHKKMQQNKIESQKLKSTDLVGHQKLEIREKEEKHDYVFGIDKINFILLHMDFSQKKEEVTLVDLWDVKTVRLNTEERRIYIPENGKFVPVEKQVLKLQLELVLRDADRPKHVLPFYHADKHNIQDLRSTQERAEYWRDITNNYLKELPGISK